MEPRTLRRIHQLSNSVEDKHRMAQIITAAGSRLTLTPQAEGTDSQATPTIPTRVKGKGQGLGSRLPAQAQRLKQLHLAVPGREGEAMTPNTRTTPQLPSQRPSPSHKELS